MDYDEVIEWADFAADPMSVAESHGVVPMSSHGGAFLYPNISGNKNYWEEHVKCYFQGADLSGPDTLVSFNRNHIKETSVSGPKRILRVIPKNGGRPFRFLVDPATPTNSIAARISELAGADVRVLGERSQELQTLMDRFGLIPLSKTHCHKIAPDLFSTRDSAKRMLADVEQESGEIVISYKAAGRGQQVTKAIVACDRFTEAADRVRAAFPDCLIIDDAA
jgi:ferredoxin